MKVVIADTSPLNYLILVDAVEIPPRLYGRVTIPDIVLRELTDEGAPEEVAGCTSSRVPSRIHRASGGPGSSDGHQLSGLELLGG